MGLDARVTTAGGAPHNTSPTTARVTTILHALDDIHIPTSHIGRSTALLSPQLGGVDDYDLCDSDSKPTSQMVYNTSFIHCLARSLASRCPHYVPRLRWRRMTQRSTISKHGEGAPARKEGAYWGIYTLPDLVVSEEKTRIEREIFDFSSAVRLCLPSSWSGASSRGVVDTLLALHSQKKKRKGGDP